MALDPGATGQRTMVYTELSWLDQIYMVDFFLLDRKGKISWKRSKRKVRVQKADEIGGWAHESCWWVTGHFGFLVPKTPWTPRIWVSCPENSFDSKNLVFLSRKLLRLWELMHSDKLKAASLFCKTAKSKTKINRTLDILGISYCQNSWNFEGCCIALWAKFQCS